MDEKIWKEVTMNVTMSKSMMIEIPKDLSNEKIKEHALKTFVSPDQVIKIMDEILTSRFNCKISESEGWNVTNKEII